MKTSSFFIASSPGRISIARFSPRRYWTLPRFMKLAPPASLIRETDRPTFERKYHAAVLSKLDAATIWAELHERVAPHEPILLCYERLSTPGEWCHREIVAVWFRDQLGHDVPELAAVHAHDSADLRRASVSRCHHHGEGRKRNDKRIEPPRRRD